MGRRDPWGHPVTAADNSRHIGPERRYGARRITSERRDMVRWEPGKADRRAARDRRTMATDHWGHNFGR
ncbi:MAG: hypothetical protein A2150_02235 [Candidatus Muproteobacteria bacterium RBG_16_64_11]|uniref:Uncharacterized protein n=1 Tax=Candidatus Muproteobacteria bacterium RBG_16_64_11 TaxID=1817758 RepID=A0A1F6TEY6_9PROT|nr:MAG: hypothetical protein A2150_02235 [Candidatus Muproteobacteria bacterium RBG_16_64_11]